MVGVSPHMGEPYFIIIIIIFFFFETIGPIEPGGGICLTTGFWAFIQPVWGCLKKKFQIRNWYSIFHRKGYIHFYCPTPRSLKNSHASVILENIVFLEKIVT